MRAGRTHDRHGPGEPARRDLASEAHLDVAGSTRGHFQLRGLQECRRNSETDAALNHVLRAARQHTGTAARAGSVRERHGHVIGADGHAGHAFAQHHLDARPPRFGEQRPVERQTIDHQRLDPFGGVRDRRASRREESDGPQRIEHDRPRHREMIEGFGREHTGAVHRVTARQMLLVDGNVEPFDGQGPTESETGGSASYDDDVTHAIRNCV